MPFCDVREQTFDYVFVNDAVEATRRELTVDASSEVFNVGSGVGACVRDLLDAMRR